MRETLSLSIILSNSIGQRSYAQLAISIIIIWKLNSTGLNFKWWEKNAQESLSLKWPWSSRWLQGKNPGGKIQSTLWKIRLNYWFLHSQLLSWSCNSDWSICSLPFVSHHTHTTQQKSRNAYRDATCYFIMQKRV